MGALLSLLLCALIACAPGPAATPVSEGSSAPRPEVPTPDGSDAPSPVATGAPDAAAPGIAPQSASPGGSDRIAASHLLVAYTGSLHARSGVHRTKAEARARAEQALARLKAGEDFIAVAREMSDDSTSENGGFLGAFGRGVMQKDFEDAAWALPVGGLSGIVETPFGFHIIQRAPLDEIHVGHILVQWAGIHGATATRTREEALAAAQAALARIRAGQPFAQVAQETSDGPTAAWGGDLGVLDRGQMVPAFDAVAFALKAGAVSEVVESPLGFHIIKRLD